MDVQTKECIVSNVPAQFLNGMLAEPFQDCAVLLLKKDISGKGGRHKTVEFRQIILPELFLYML